MSNKAIAKVDGIEFLVDDITVRRAQLPKAKVIDKRDPSVTTKSYPHVVVDKKGPTV